MKLSDVSMLNIGQWVTYKGGAGDTALGRIKSFNDKFIFVVFKCANDWKRFEGYTAAGCKPEDLTFSSERKST
jgi:hypothetical protein